MFASRKSKTKIKQHSFFYSQSIVSSKQETLVLNTETFRGLRASANTVLGRVIIL